MNVLKILVNGLFLFALFTQGVNAAQDDVEQAIEAEQLKISLDEKTGMGYVYGKICDECEKIKVSITPKAKAFEGRKQVALGKAKRRLGQQATVIFDRETMEVIRIRW